MIPRWFRVLFPPRWVLGFRWAPGDDLVQSFASLWREAAERVEGGGRRRHFVSFLWCLARGAAFPSRLSCMKFWEGGFFAISSVRGEWECPDSATLSRTLGPAPRGGPLCRSAASGHLVRARALLSPPPLSGGAHPPSPPRVGPAFCRETLSCGLRCERSVGLRPPGSLGKGRDCCSRLVATRPGAEARGPGHASVGGREIGLRTWGRGLRVFPPKFLFYEMRTERDDLPRPHSLPVLFLRGKGLVSCTEEMSRFYWCVF